MSNVHIDHVAMCVYDLEQAIRDWKDILDVLSPEHALRMTRGGGRDVVAEVGMTWATFQNPDPTGISIQLWAPTDENSWVHKVLAKRGEFVHHICFLSDDFGSMVQSCRRAGLPVVQDEDGYPDTMPWLQWNFISDKKAHGPLIELATRYTVQGDRWVPRLENVENRGREEELRARYWTNADEG